MILQKLYEYAQREELLQDTAFEQVPVHWVLRIRANGDLASVEPQLTGDVKRPRGRNFLVPKDPARSVNVAASFLTGNDRYVLGESRDPKKPNDPERNPRCRESFVGLLREAARDTGDDLIQSALLFYAAHAPDSVGHFRYQDVLPAEIPGGERLALAVYSKDAGDFVLLTEHPPLVAWWRARFNTKPASEEPVALAHCLISGAMAEPARLHDKLYGLSGGQSTGTSLVSFNEPAFVSHGLEQSYNAPVSKEAMLGYTLALNRLLERDEATRRNLVLPGDLTVCMFLGGRTRLASDEVDAAADLIGKLDPDEGQAIELGDSLNWDATKSLFEAAYKGRNWTPLNDTRQLFVLALTPNAGRAVVREWFEGTVSEVARSVDQYFRDLAIIDQFTPTVRAFFTLRTPSGKAKREAGEEPPLAGTARKRRPPVGLLNSLRPKGKQDIPADLSRQFILAALDQRRAFPISVLEAAVRRIRAEAASSEYGAVSVNRAALIKAYLNRELRRAGSPLLSQFQSQDPDFKEVQVSLDPNCHIPAYLLGRLMAVMEQAQSLAIGKDINASIVDKAYGAASATPATVMCRLLRGVRYHLSKAGKDQELWRRVHASDLELLLDNISDKFEKPGVAFPSSLSLPDQGLFSLGYYQQRCDLPAYFARRKQEREDKRTQKAESSIGA